MPAVNLYSQIELAIKEQDADRKARLAKRLLEGWSQGELNRESHPVEAFELPGLPENVSLVHPKKLPKRKLGSREGVAALVHAFVHIEFMAINLALDAAYRFRDMPDDFIGDWLEVAAEEALHFCLLRERLVSYGYDYGSFAAHDGLWVAARQSEHDVLVRLALVPRFMEARGLDVTPDMISRFEKLNDSQTADVLRVILRDEITHVKKGSKWFEFVCDERKLDSQEMYLAILDKELGERARGDLNKEARLQAGFTEEELHLLKA